MRVAVLSRAAILMARNDPRHARTAGFSARAIFATYGDALRICETHFIVPLELQLTSRVLTTDMTRLVQTHFF